MKPALLSGLCLFAFMQAASGEEILLRCRINLPNSDKSFISNFQISDQRVIGDGTTITRKVTINPATIEFTVDNFLLNFLTNVKINRDSGAYTEIRADRKTNAIVNEWHGTCAKAEKPTS
ncbi:MAG TPA: hypothetical protein VE986_02615 [Hyphomicrobiales bacterium]|nr:hypothetical protein [Hyphomicrobiales bacterium]